MQNAERFDAIERTADRGQFENISLGIFDVLQPLLARLSSRIGEAHPAEVNCENARVRRLLRNVKGMFARAAAGNEDILDVFQLSSGIGYSVGIAAERGQWIDRPTRVWIFLVLPHDLPRRPVFDLG